MSSRIVLVGIGGASCSGKTTLAKHLASILPQSYLVHQDDYAPAEELIPIHPEHRIRDWDAAPTALEWNRFLGDLQATKRGDALDESKRSQEHLNLLTDVPVRNDIKNKWKEAFQSSSDTLHTKYVLIEGFLMYWHPQIHSLLDIRLLVRSAKSTIHKRRSDRNDRISEDSFWKDPPGCFENIVWPAYVDAHSKVFAGGDVEHGRIDRDAEITLLEADLMDMSEMVDRACASIWEHREA